MNRALRIAFVLLLSPLLAVSPSPLLADGTLFGPSTDYNLGIPLMRVAAGDYSGEGAVDIIVTYPSLNWYTTAYGSGTGTFSFSTTYSTTGIATSIAFGFFDDDDDLDMALACPANNCVAVLINSGAAEFYDAVNYATGTQPVSVVAGDLDDDGYDDLVTANSGDDSVTVMLNDKDGTFTSTSHLIDLGVTAEPTAIALGDFNGDDDLDIAVLLGVGSFWPMWNDGNGAFTFAETLCAVSTDPVAIVSADFNEDGYDDVAAVRYVPDGDHSIYLWTGGEGDDYTSFDGPNSHAVGNYLTSIAAGDFDGDGHLDLAVSDENDDQVSVLLGDGAGDFAAPDDYAVGDEPVWIVAGDFDANGDCDLATANNAGLSMSVLLSLGGAPTTVDVTLDLAAGWNMVSVPLEFPDGEDTVEAIFGDVDHGDIYAWVPAPAGGSYLKLEGDDVVDPHLAYWVSITTAPAEPVTLTGEPVSVDEWSTNLSTGWNMVGTAWSENPIPVSDLSDGGSGALQDDAIYWWDAEHKNYELLLPDDDLVPGVGYWMACTAGCTVTMAPPGV